MMHALCAVTGCSLLPRSEFKQPQVSIPQQWQNQAVTGNAVANGQKWWQSFNDPLLNDLIDRALRSNNDLTAATIRVQRARLQSSLTDTNLTPSVTAAANSSRSYNLNGGSGSWAHSVSAGISYELDLWGRLSSLRDAGRWEAEATEVDRRNTALALIGTTASAYWQVAFLNQRIAISEASIATADKTLSLVRTKYNAGAVSGIELAQAHQSLAAQRATLTQLQQQRSEARSALAILFDQAPQNSVPERLQLPDGPLPTIDAGLPASLLGRRPDLAAAELRLSETLANVDATTAGFFPAFTLTGSLGGSSISLENVLKNPIVTLGMGLTLPFIQWNTAKLTINVSETQYQEAVVTFRQTLYKALSDVENTLSALVHYRKESVQLELALETAKRAEQLAEIRYRAGATGVQAWLDQQELRRSAEINLAENRLNRLKNHMKLYQALGGDMGIGVKAEMERKAGEKS
ncbi:MAG: efflux transporter outer membrane subunit [Desulfuromonadales bacterium]|nr:efflux transporter outer membrane subunit [Desulfuromonadales bacterium]